MLFPYTSFRSLHGRCFRFVFTCLIIYSIIRLPLIRCIFRKVPDPTSSFYIHDYLFEFTHRGSDKDILCYNISCDDFRMKFTIYGIDTSANCDTYSNLNFGTFIWQNFDRFNFVRYAVTHVRRDYLSLPELLSKILYGRVCRMEKRYTLRYVYHEVSV